MFDSIRREDLVQHVYGYIEILVSLTALMLMFKTHMQAWLQPIGRLQKN